MSEQIINKSIKEKLMSSQKIDSLWESFCDCISPELNNIRVVGDEIKNLYDINKTSSYKSLGETFGYSPNVIIRNDKDFQKLEVESISNRIRNKTTYNGYNIGAKQIGKETNTFNFYWDGDKLIRAIKVGETYQNMLGWDKSNFFDGVIPDKNFSEISSSSAKLDDNYLLDTFILDKTYLKTPTHHIGVEYFNENHQYNHINSLLTNDGVNYYINLIFIHEVNVDDILIIVNGEILEPIDVQNKYITYDNGYVDLSNSYCSFKFDTVDENREVLISYVYDNYLIDYLYFNYLDKCSIYNKRVPIIHHNGYQINCKTSYLSTDNRITSYLLPIENLGLELVKLDDDLNLDENWTLDEFIKNEDFDNNPYYIKFGTKMNRNIYPYKDEISDISKYFNLSTSYSDKSVTLTNVTLKTLNGVGYSVKECSYMKNNSNINIINADTNFEFFFVILEDGEIFNNDDLRIYAENNNLHFISKTESILHFDYGVENRILFQYDKSKSKYQIFRNTTTEFVTLESNDSFVSSVSFGKYNNHNSFVGYIWNVITRSTFIESQLIINYITNNYEVLFTDIRNPIKTYTLSQNEIYTENNVQYMINTIISYPQLDDEFSENKYVFTEKPKQSSIILKDDFGNTLRQRIDNTIVDNDNSVVGIYDDSIAQLSINEEVTLMEKKKVIDGDNQEKTLTKIIYRDGTFKYFDDDVEETNKVNEISDLIFINGIYKTTNGNVIIQNSDKKFYLNNKNINPVYIDEYYNCINYKIDDKFYNSFRNDGLNEIKKVRFADTYDTEYDLYSIGNKLYLYPELNDSYEVRVWRIENSYESTIANVYDDHTFDKELVNNVYYTYAYSLGINTSDLYDSLSFTRKINLISDMEITSYKLINQTIKYEVENWKITTIKEIEYEDDELLAFVEDKTLILTQNSNVVGKKLNIESDPTLLIIDEERYEVDCEIEISQSIIDEFLDYSPLDNSVTIIYTLSNGITKIITCDGMGVFDDDYVHGVYVFANKNLQINLKDDSLVFTDFIYQYMYTIENKYYNRKFKINYQLVNPMDVSEIGIYNRKNQLLFYSTFPYVELINNSYISLCLLLDYVREGGNDT